MRFTVTTIIVVFFLWGEIISGLSVVIQLFLAVLTVWLFKEFRKKRKNRSDVK